MTAFVGASLTETYTAAQLRQGKAPGVGDRYVDSEGRSYRFVKYNAAVGVVAAVANNFCYLYAPSGVSAGAYNEVTSDLSDSANIGAGMLMAVIPSGDYGWIQTGGIATLTTALTAGADGNAMTAAGATDGTIDVSAAVTDFICAVAVDASAKIVMLTCP